MAGKIEARLAELGIAIPAPGEPAGNYVGYVVSLWRRRRRVRRRTESLAGRSGGRQSPPQKTG